MIGVYVHHRGRGHLHRVLPVVAALRDRGEEVTLLVTGPIDEALRPPGVDVHHLPAASGAATTVTAGGPDSEHLPLASRRAALAWMDRMRPRVFWVDSSPAMSLAGRMTGTPLVSTLPPGVRHDEPHVLRCRSADRLIGAWPPGAQADTVASTGHPVDETGGISRFERRDRDSPTRRGPRVVHLSRSGARGDHRFWRAVRSTVERSGVADWVELGGPDGLWHHDPWPELCSADVVVTGAGQASVADAACADVPMVVVPGRHEFGEYRATADALAGIPGATVSLYGDGPTAVALAVQAQVARSLDGASTGIRRRWGVDGAAARAAEVIRAADETATTTTTRTARTGRNPHPNGAWAKSHYLV